MEREEGSLRVVERWNIALRENDTISSARRIFGDGTAMMIKKGNGNGTGNGRKEVERVMAGVGVGIRLWRL